jgi:hypothetical protein
MRCSVEIAVHSFFVSLPAAVAVWMVLLLGVALAVSLMGLPRTLITPVSAAVLEDRRYAGEVAGVAERAAVTAARHRAAWAVAQQELEVAWHAFDEAERAARRVATAGAFPLMSRSRKLGENVDRERYLHHAATEACRNRDISIAQLNDVYAHRGWNPRLHPVVQEAALRQAAREHRYADYQRAAERERAAWQTAETAAEALRSLRVEATAALARIGAERPVADERWFADQWATGEFPVAA